jgi:hypothetical protein|nr:hypothetical protein [uncultured Clostridium sp.]
MGSRLELQNLLESILGSRNVYYQPPESIKIKYPAIIYSRNNIDNNFADDIVYMQNHTYQIIVIDANPDSEIVNKISKLPMCRYNRHYTSDNLNHDVFILNY